eukprot:COSAG01_NODE_13464_length_1582_cov_8.531826_2_plen_78_part_00
MLQLGRSGAVEAGGAAPPLVKVVTALLGLLAKLTSKAFIDFAADESDVELSAVTGASDGAEANAAQQASGRLSCRSG